MSKIEKLPKNYEGYIEKLERNEEMAKKQLGALKTDDRVIASLNDRRHLFGTPTPVNPKPITEATDPETQAEIQRIRAIALGQNKDAATQAVEEVGRNIFPKP